MEKIILKLYILLKKVFSYVRFIPLKIFGLNVGKNVSLWGHSTFSFFTLKNITLGNNIFINSNCTFISLPSPKSKKFGVIKIGNGTHINKNANIVSNESISIGNDCLFAINVSIFDHEHIFSKKIHSTTQNLRTGKKISIGNDVYLGNNVVVLKGVTLGNHVVVGANSVVSKSFPSNSVIAGIPAKIIKRLKA